MGDISQFYSSSKNPQVLEYLYSKSLYLKRAYWVDCQSKVLC